MNPAETGREHLVARAFVSLADTLVDEYLLDRLVGYSVELLAADAAGILLADARGELRAAAASNQDAQLERRRSRRGHGRVQRPVEPGYRHFIIADMCR